MKLTPEEKKLEKNFRPGALSKDGFLGTDTRHVHDIIRADAAVLASLHIGAERIAARMQYFLDCGKEGLEQTVTFGGHTVQIRWDRGKIPCPFGHAGVYPLIHVTLENRSLNRTLKYASLSIHLIRSHGFFGGRGSVYRIDPENAVQVLDLKNE
ncbi:hypothetical protein JW948_16980 [bacterium]|nr:hypothetical protein [bacterium]